MQSAHGRAGGAAGKSDKVLRGPCFLRWRVATLVHPVLGGEGVKEESIRMKTTSPRMSMRLIVSIEGCQWTETPRALTNRGQRPRFCHPERPMGAINAMRVICTTYMYRAALYIRRVDRAVAALWHLGLADSKLSNCRAEQALGLVQRSGADLLARAQTPRVLDEQRTEGRVLRQRRFKEAAHALSVADAVVAHICDVQVRRTGAAIQTQTCSERQGRVAAV